MNRKRKRQRQSNNDLFAPTATASHFLLPPLVESWDIVWEGTSSLREELKWEKRRENCLSGFPPVLGSYPFLRFNHILPSILLINSHYPLTEKKKMLGSRQWREKGSGKPLGRLFCGNISVYTGMNLHKGRGWGGSPVGSQNSNIQNK